MTVMAHEPQAQEDTLLEGFLALQTPEGFRAELIDGEIVVTPPPGGGHDKNIWKLVRQVVEKSDTRFDFWGNKGLVTPSGGRCPKNHVIPDGTFVREEADLYNDDESWSPAEGIDMVVEVTSSRPGPDRVAKRHCYARAGIPLYLLVDREKQRVTLFSEPEDDDYHRVVWVPFGKPIALPEPFDFELDTSELF
ncbi:Uma2 family endonuclease [Actinomadura sp. NPDC047616]|uniref:Uma2 family endonuclease n=1 Tax=Actinomadura sp. NPDC047616 TaxID=3155914 RepID=UPI0033DC9ED5